MTEPKHTYIQVADDVWLNAAHIVSVAVTRGAVEVVTTGKTFDLWAESESAAKAMALGIVHASVHGSNHEVRA